MGQGILTLTPFIQISATPNQGERDCQHNDNGE